MKDSTWAPFTRMLSIAPQTKLDLGPTPRRELSIFLRKNRAWLPFIGRKFHPMRCFSRCKVTLGFCRLTICQGAIRTSSRALSINLKASLGGKWTICSYWSTQLGLQVHKKRVISADVAILAHFLRMEVHLFRHQCHILIGSGRAMKKVCRRVKHFITPGLSILDFLAQRWEKARALRDSFLRSTQCWAIKKIKRSETLPRARNVAPDRLIVNVQQLRLRVPPSKLAIDRWDLEKLTLTTVCRPVVFKKSVQAEKAKSRRPNSTLSWQTALRRQRKMEWGPLVA